MRWSKVSALIALLFLPLAVNAAMSSTNYFIYADSLDYGGGASTSTNNSLQDSIGGELAGGESSSATYEIKAGYQAMESGTLTLNLDSNSINFGQPAAGVVVSSSLSATVNTDAGSGYTLSISNVSGNSLSGVLDGVVDGVGSLEEYGLAVSGANAAYLNDAQVAPSLILSYSFSAVANDITTLIFKAVRSSGTAVQTYSQNLVLTAAAN